jgi:hypothetical protein
MSNSLNEMFPVLFVFTLFAAGFFSLRQRRRGRMGRLRPLRLTERYAQARITWAGTYTEGFQRALDVLALMDARLSSADPHRGTIIAHAPADLSFPPSPGETLRIAVTQQDGMTFVYMESAPLIPHYLAPARRRLNHFLNLWDRLPTPVSETRKTQVAKTAEK